MWIVLTVLIIVLSCFVAASDMDDNLKTGYFVVAGILFLVPLVLTLIFGG